MNSRQEDGTSTRVAPSHKLPTMTVVMATYNGERFLEEQVESILNQEGVSVCLFIRDDGSTDRTLDLLDSLAAKDERITVHRGDNVGVKSSFFHALKEAPASNYYAFADQDDIWMPRKLAAAMDHLQGQDEEPFLYCCNSHVFDEQLNMSKPMYSDDPAKDASLGSLLSANPFPGMTMVFNKKACELFLRFYPGGVFFHDHWMFFLCKAFGRFVFDTNQYVRYRQHGNNAMSAGTFETGLKSIASKVLFLKDKEKHGEYPLDAVAEKLLLCCKDELETRPEIKRYLEACAQYRDSTKCKLRLLSSKETARQDIVGTCILRFRILTGLF